MAEANGRQFDEMHADGGVNGPLFFGPESYLLPASRSGCRRRASTSSSTAS